MRKIEVSETQNEAFEKQAAASIGAVILAAVALGVSHALQAFTEVKDAETPNQTTSKEG